jgi:hypothetical protein
MEEVNHLDKDWFYKNYSDLFGAKWTRAERDKEMEEESVNDEVSDFETVECQEQKCSWHGYRYELSPLSDDNHNVCPLCGSIKVCGVYFPEISDK